MPCVEDDVPISVSMETNSDVNQERTTTNERNAEGFWLACTGHPADHARRSPLSNAIKFCGNYRRNQQETHPIGIHDVLRGLQSIIGQLQTFCEFSDVIEYFKAAA